MRAALTYEQMDLVLKLRAAGNSQDAIAETVGCSQAAVSRVLTMLADSRQIAKKVLDGGAVRMARRFVREAKPPEILEVFDRQGVAEKRQIESNRSGVQVFIGVQGQLPGADPVLISTNTGESPTEHALLKEAVSVSTSND